MLESAMFALVFRTAVFAAIFVGIGMTFCGAYHAIRALFCRRTDAPFRWIVAINPLNAVLFADQLNEVGLHHRSKAFKYYTRAIACFAIVVLVASVVLIANH